MADGGEEARFGLAGVFGPLARGDQRRFGALAGGDVAGDGAMRNRAAVLVAHRQFDPGEPARAARRADGDVGGTQALIVGKGGVGHDADLDAEFGKGLAGKIALIGFDQIGEHLVGIDDVAVAVAMDDEIAERVDETAKALLAFLHLPHAVGERLDLGAAAGGGLVEQHRGAVDAASGMQMHAQGRRGRWPARPRLMKIGAPVRCARPASTMMATIGQQRQAFAAWPIGCSGTSGGAAISRRAGARGTASTSCAFCPVADCRIPRSCETLARQRLWKIAADRSNFSGSGVLPGGGFAADWQFRPLRTGQRATCRRRRGRGSCRRRCRARHR